MQRRAAPGEKCSAVKLHNSVSGARAENELHAKKKSKSSKPTRRVYKLSGLAGRVGVEAPIVNL